MRLQRIYSSKLYVTSTRKDRIHAAIDKAINTEFVLQLEDYLDDEAKEELRYAKNEIERDDSNTDSTAGGADTFEGSDTPSETSRGGSSFTPSSFSGSPIDDFGDDEMGDFDISDESGDIDIPSPAESEAPAPEEVVESVTQEGKPITATSLIWTTIEDISNECDVIKGTLNARDDTKGVIRLEVKDSELWIYYSDDSNLNDRMIEVISVLNSTGYTYLKFNRLARSNNAIVFDVNLNSSEQIKPDSEIKEDKKAK